MATLLQDGSKPRDPGVQQFLLERWIDLAPFEDYVGLTIEAVGGGEAELSVPFRLCLANGGGVLHGGALTTLADTAVAMAIKSLLPEGTVFATTELQTSFLAPVTAGTVTARAKVRGPEGRTFYGDAELFAVDGTLVARFTAVFRVARGQGFVDP
jgi:uncharacterized protein (TIGR00369 family)